MMTTTTIDHKMTHDKLLDGLRDLDVCRKKIQDSVINASQTEFIFILAILTEVGKIERDLNQLICAINTDTNI